MGGNHPPNFSPQEVHMNKKDGQVPELMVTLRPSFPHFQRFTADHRLAGIRINVPMLTVPELQHEFGLASMLGGHVPLWFDIKGRQLRVIEVHMNPDYLDVTLNHPIAVPTPTTVLFKAGVDPARLVRLEDGGQRLIFEGGPRYLVKAGESLHIRDPRLNVGGAQFTDVELEKIGYAKKAGFTRWFLSYVQSQRDVDEFLELVGPGSEILLKIENKKGLSYVANEFKKRDGIRLVAARGDLYVEINRPHEITDAVKLIIGKDPEANVGSRILLSVLQESVLAQFSYVVRSRPKEIDYDKLLQAVHRPSVPSCADWHEIAWLMDIGYQSFLLCDELCLYEELLDAAVDAFDEFRQVHKPALSHARWPQWRKFFSKTRHAR